MLMVWYNTLVFLFLRLFSMLLVWYTHLGVPLPEAGLHAVDLITGGQTLAEETNKMENL